LIEIFKVKNFTDYSLADSINAAVASAHESAESGDAVLFTPAFASFGMFQNEYDRGDKYNAAVKSL
jgi:UDP-N-acetylmuramoylalanine--D-glutamate ligase